VLFEGVTAEPQKESEIANNSDARSGDEYPNFTQIKRANHPSIVKPEHANLVIDIGQIRKICGRSQICW
jgi:hypothetical protein